MIIGCQDDLWAKVFELWYPSVRDILKRIGGVDGEAEENHMGVRVRKWPQPVKKCAINTFFCGN